jgi:branched-chain amino acid transport system permease protein
MADAPAAPRTPRLIERALRSAAFTALVTLGLAFPIIALRTEQDLMNRIVLEPRWGLVAVLCAIAFAGRFAWLLITGGRARAGPPITPRTRFARFDGPLRRVVPPLALAAVLAYPLLVLAVAGTGGALKWIDNFGILILIFVMLGWGLNIVVGLAGLLDLGYVAFYAVGAYATALIATHFGFSYWMCLPLAGLFAALWGAATISPSSRSPSAKSSASC